MHEQGKIERELRTEAERLSKKYRGAPVVTIVAGDKGAAVPRCMLGSTLHGESRLRDLVGILETAKQIEVLKHFRLGPFGKQTQRSSSTKP